MTETVETRLTESYRQYYKDTLGIPDWEHWTGNRSLQTGHFKDISTLVEMLGPLDHKVILDLGCGWGDTIAQVKQRFPNSTIYGLEPDSERLTLARDRFLEDGPGSIHLFQSNGENIPLSGSSVDLIYSYSVLEHVQSRNEVLRECFRILRKGGWMHITTPNYMNFFEPHYKIAWAPFLPKPLAAIYLKLRKRPVSFLPYFDYTISWNMEKLLNQYKWTWQDLIWIRLQKNEKKFSKRFPLNLLGKDQKIARFMIRSYQFFRSSRLEYLIQKD
jgi:ubiquinone/menaquinone biosynthesis C-methylase UbiE